MWVPRCNPKKIILCASRDPFQLLSESDLILLVSVITYDGMNRRLEFCYSICNFRLSKLPLSSAWFARNTFTDFSHFYFRDDSRFPILCWGYRKMLFMMWQSWQRGLYINPTLKTFLYSVVHCIQLRSNVIPCSRNSCWGNVWLLCLNVSL